MQIYIKFFTIFLCSFLVSSHIADVKRSIRHTITALCTCITATLPILFINQYLPAIIPLYIATVLVIYYAVRLSISIKAICILTLFAQAISYIALILSSTITALCSYAFITIDHYPRILLQFIAAVLQLVLILLFLHLKRLRHGLPFIYKASNSGLLISIALLSLFACTVISCTPDQLLTLIPFFLVYIIGIFFFDFMQHQFKQMYLLKITQRDNDSLQHTLEQLQSENLALKSEIKNLTHIIHEDNKLIPALETAVKSFIASNETTDAQLLQALSDQSQRRQSDIASADRSLYSNLETGLSSINILIQYYYQRSMKENIHFSCQTGQELLQLTQLGFTEHDLTVILADLLENAFYAVKDVESKNILLSTSSVDSRITLNIYDSGILFPVEVLKKMGIEEYTSHKENGGSGIGLMHLYQFIHSHHISYLLQEFDTESTIYTKKISLLFNDTNSGSMILKTTRADILEELSVHNPNWII